MNGRLDILTQATQREFERPPSLNHEQRRIFLQWGYFRVCGRFFSHRTFVAADVIHVARLLAVDPLQISLHGYNHKTIFRHRQIIRQDVGFMYSQQGHLFSTHTPNTLAGIRTALVEFKALAGWIANQAVFCMEHTATADRGYLQCPFAGIASPARAGHLVRVLPTDLKQAGGMQPHRRTGGKTDKVDAQRIAQYAFRFRDQMRLWEPPREIIQKLAFLSATRQRLNQAYNLLAVPVAEQETFIGKSLQKTLKGNRSANAVKKSLAALKEEQQAVDQQIKELGQADVRLKELFELMVSVPSIGPVIATELLITTNEMKTINEAKKLAAPADRCHAGVAPFEYRSIALEPAGAPVRFAAKRR